MYNNVDSFRVGKFGTDDARPGHHRRRRNGGAVLSDSGYAGRRDVRAGHRSAGRVALVRRSHRATGAVLVRSRHDGGAIVGSSASRSATAATASSSCSRPFVGAVSAAVRHPTAARAPRVGVGRAISRCAI